MKQSKILNIPRERHYTLGHEGFRQLCEYDPHQFFEIMISEKKLPFITELVTQIESNCPEDPTQIDPAVIKTVPTAVGNRPLLIIEMPPVKAFAECIYIGIVLEFDIQQPQQTERPDIHYFTFELGEGETELCKMFCQWQGDTHYNLGELDKSAGLEEFILVIKQRLGEAS